MSDLGIPMPSIHRLDNATIYVYADDHPPPHFNVRGANSDANIRLDTLQVLIGEIDRKDFAQAIAWASIPENWEKLMKAWRGLNESD
jgi:Domain of unknown function (DUF4160)